MTQLILALVFLYATHFGISSTPLRGLLIRRLGQNLYLAVYSLVALLAIVWLVQAYRGAPYIGLWPGLPWLVALAHVAVLLAALFLIAGVSTPNPTAVNQSAALEQPEPVRGVLRVTRHPVMWGIALWGLGHLAANGDLAAVLFFGGLAGLALIGTVLIDRKYEARLGDAYRVFQGKTSAMPFVAIAAGRQRLVFGEIGAARIGGALLLFAILYAVHPWILGVAPY